MIYALAFTFQSETQQEYPPGKFGTGKGVGERLRMWAVDGTWQRVFTALRAQSDADDDLGRAVSGDFTVVRAHRYAATAGPVKPYPHPRHQRRRQPLHGRPGPGSGGSGSGRVFQGLDEEMGQTAELLGVGPVELLQRRSQSGLDLDEGLIHHLVPLGCEVVVHDPAPGR